MGGSPMSTTELDTLRDSAVVVIDLANDFVYPGGVIADAGGPEYQRRAQAIIPRSEEHTSELQSQSNLVCRLLLEKKKKLPARRGDDVCRLAVQEASPPADDAGHP